MRAAIIGVSGRMGQALVRAAASESIEITAAVASAKSEALGKDAGVLAGVTPLGVTVTADLPAALGAADVAIDFSNAAATQSNLAACRQARKPLLIGTTGFSLDSELQEAAREIPVLVAPNTSLGVTLLIELVRQAAAALPAAFDIEIIEAHHRMKKDAPSGTALALGQAAAQGRAQPLDGVRQEGAARRGAEIGFAVVRAGDIVGEHSVLFAGMGESLTLSHRATDRAIFARGALQAAAWLESRAPGQYFMRDLFTHKSGS
ncbi:MAG: 4-hydroxy-tetrahydrodipicolinate reductase [Proteobacteria bacterium]|nr:4-hydroxy-tetrahydrodipicolinate reductase [Pseudomonadota bacterium]